MQEEISQKINAAMDALEVNVTIDGNRAHIDVVSHHFAGMNRVQKQQAVYACIQNYIADGRLHAVTIKADVPPEPTGTTE
jgi:acid stress-induced BolA-like protein IbaG/YrbA